MDDTGELLTPRQVAAKLQVSVGTVLRLLRKSRLRGVKLGKYWRVRPSDLESYLEQASGGENQTQAEPLIAARSIGLSPGWKIVGIGVFALLLVQVTLLLLLLVMVLAWRQTGIYGSDARSTYTARSYSVEKNGRESASGGLSTSSNVIGSQGEGTIGGSTVGSAYFFSSPTPTSVSSTRDSSTLRCEPPLQAYLFVGNTGGEGVNIRTEPGGAYRIRAWPDGARMLVAGCDLQVGGRIWKNVVDPDGAKGWVAAEYLVENSPTPTAWTRREVSIGPTGTVQNVEPTNRKDR